MAIVCKRCLIFGQVQGVAYRIHTVWRARQFHLSGWVRNLPDGCVECYIQGEPEQLDDMLAWFWQGSPLSKVSDIRCSDEKPIDSNGFKVV